MEYINAMIYALKSAKIRAEWYETENNPRYLEECRDWIEVAKIYSDQIAIDSKADLTSAA